MKTKRFSIKGYLPVANKLVSLIALVFFSASTVFALPAGQQVVNGQASFNTQGNSLTVTNSPNSIINWQSFSISSNEAVRFIQQSSSSAVLNRVIGQDPSRILGLLESNGRVFLINPNGILFGQGARIDVNGLVASTLDISNQDFLAGKYNFTAGSVAGSIQNQGSITTPEGGKVYLIAPNVENTGIINSPKGDVILAAGHSVQLVDSLDPDISVVVSAPENTAVNIGEIIAQSGKVGIYGGLIYQKGLVNADSAVVGENGRILLKASKDVTLDAGSVTIANGPQGGQIKIESESGTTLVSGTVTAVGNDGKGGDIQVLGNQVELTGSAFVDASGKSGGGTILIGGDYQGKNPAVRNAETTSVGKDVVIKADALENGDGGNVIVWADDKTEFYGRINARGGASGGDGGNAEVSGKLTLVYRGLTDLRAPKGKTGMLLLDPTNYFILPVGGDITGALLGTQLDAANVTIQTATGGVQNGDIYVDDTVTWTSANQLTLSAHDNILVNNTLTNNGGGSLILRADSDGSGGGTVYFNPTSMVNITGGGGGSVSIYYNPADYLVATYSADVATFNSKVTAGARAYYMLVNDVVDLQAINTNLAGRYALGKNIDASATVGWNAGKGFDPLGDNSLIPAQSFTGIFDGLGHTITDLYINRTTGADGDYVGLFGGCGAATIINVGMINVNITGHFQVGGLVAHTGGTISNCYTTGTVTGTSNTVGGLVGLSAGSTSNSYSRANVSGASFVGGLIGANYDATSSVTNSYSTGLVTATGQKGGLSGYNTGTITGSYWDTQTSGLATSYGGTGKTTAEMQNELTYVGWDFIPPSTDTWSISAGQYPLINGYAIVAPPDWTPPTPPAPPPEPPPAPTPTSAPGVTGNSDATGNTVVALETAAVIASVTISDDESSGDQEDEDSEESTKKDTKRGEQKTYEKTLGDKGKKFCN